MIGIKQRVLLILLSIISLVFIFRLLHLQIFTSDFKLLSEQNIIQENVIFPSRGIVFDRNNKIIVANRAIYDILVVPKDIELEDTTSFLKLFCRRTKNDYTLFCRICKEIQYPHKLHFYEKLKEQYRKEFPRGTRLVCACEKGRMVDVKILIEIGGGEAGMEATAMVRETGTLSNGYSTRTPLIAAAENKHSTVAEYLVEIMYPNATELEKKYYLEFPRGTPLVCACEKGRVKDVKGMIRGARAAGMDVTAMVSEVGTDSDAISSTPLMEAAYYECSTIIEILLQYNADTATTDSTGSNALHYAAAYNKTTTTTVQLLLNNMKLEDINHKDEDGDTPLDWCYECNKSSIKQQLIDLIRQKGGKRKSEL